MCCCVKGMQGMKWDPVCSYEDLLCVEGVLGVQRGICVEQKGIVGCGGTLCGAGGHYELWKRSFLWCAK